MGGFYFANGIIIGFALGVFVVGVFAPWLVVDTTDKIEKLAREAEYEAEKKKREKKDGK